jgi:hypothetical protein
MGVKQFCLATSAWTVLGLSSSLWAFLEIDAAEIIKFRESKIAYFFIQAYLFKRIQILRFLVL